MNPPLGSTLFFLRSIAVVASYGLWVLLLARVDAQPPKPRGQTAANEGSRHKQRLEQIARWIEQLNADSYEERETASRRLIEAGQDARPQVAAAARHESAEVRFRAAAILEALEQKPLRDLEQEILTFVAQPDEQLDIERGMCLISRILDPQVREKDLVKKLDEIAEKVHRRLGKETDPVRADPQKAVAAITHVVFQDYKIRGNEEDYDNPDNCSLAFVLATRKGKPILLGQLLVAVARRLKIPLVGVPVTGQYLVKYDGVKAPPDFPRDDIYLHPFQQGKILSRDDRARDYPHHDPDQMVPPATNRQTLARLLNNILGDLDERDDAAAPHRRRLAQMMFEMLQPAGAR
jgi:regulator of sirC expression with transglutaminase-like and TPR domain